MTDALPAFIENKTFEELAVGDSASLSRTLTQEDIIRFAEVTGDFNPAHLDEAYAKTDIFHRIVGHGMWTGSMFSALLGMYLPGPGTVYLSQSLKFLRPVTPGDTVTATVTVTAKDAEHGRVTLSAVCVNDQGKRVIEGEALVMAPTEKIRRATPRPPARPAPFCPEPHRYERTLIERAKNEPRLRVAVAHPVDALSLSGALEAAELGLIEPVLIGPEHKIRAAAEEAGLDLHDIVVEHAPHSHAAAAKAAEMTRRGLTAALMKGALHTDELLEAVLDKASGLRTDRRMSHVFVMDVPSYSKPLYLTDAAVNIFPGLAVKKDIVQNAVDLFRALQNETPKVALLSAVETVTEKLPSTLEAAALCKMSERGQITGALLEGPLAYDNAVSREAASVKGISSPVAGDADILVAPDLEAGNMLYKQLHLFSGAPGAGIVLGASAPIILTSRSDDAESRAASCALALLYARSPYRRKPGRSE